MTDRDAAAPGPAAPEVLPLRLPSAIAAEFRVSATAVRTAMHDGRLRYYIAWGATSPTHLVDPEDAAKLWPKRRRPWTPPVFDSDDPAT